MSSDTVNFAAFMRLSAPPTPATLSSAAQTGESLFTSVGCGSCHSASLTTWKSPFTGMSYVAYRPHSDFALHHMGPNLADGITQGLAGQDEFRTAPLWGLGQRLFFLHDGRASELLEAIQRHSAPGNNCPPPPRPGDNPPPPCGSEANGTVANFNALNPGQKQDLLNFLRTL